MLIYEVLNGYLARTQEVSDVSPVPIGWVKQRPPALGVGEYAAWVGSWIVTTVPPMPAEPQYDPGTEKLIWTGSGWLVEPV